MKEALDAFEKLMRRNYDFPNTKIINGFGSEKCEHCDGYLISVSVNPQYKEFAFKQHPMPRTFMGYQVKIRYSQPYIAL